jgi:hypothetical protein
MLWEASNLQVRSRLVPVTLKGGEGVSVSQQQAPLSHTSASSNNKRMEVRPRADRQTLSFV